jgi:deoxyribonuclease V
MNLELPNLELELRQLLAQVPPGRVTTCGLLARALGDVVAARWIGHFLLHHEHAAVCPCHRVVRAGGVLGPYIAGPAAKRRLLRAEGIKVRGDTLDLEQCGHEQSTSARPLERLRRQQEQWASQVVLRSPRELPPLVAGVDVCYPQPGHGQAAYALIDADSGQLVWHATVRRPVSFPYISSYLTFRELPILLELLDEVRAAGRLASLLLVDGSGILHPRGAGSAACLGVAAGIATIGVTKKLLCGQVEIAGMVPLESRPVRMGDRLLGVALRPTAGSRRPIFISPGHGVNLPFAEQAVRCLLRGRRLPEPIYWADRLSRTAKES